MQDQLGCRENLSRGVRNLTLVRRKDANVEGRLLASPFSGTGSILGAGLSTRLQNASSVEVPFGFLVEYKALSAHRHTLVFMYLQVIHRLFRVLQKSETSMNSTKPARLSEKFNLCDRLSVEVADHEFLLAHRARLTDLRVQGWVHRGPLSGFATASTLYARWATRTCSPALMFLPCAFFMVFSSSVH